MAQEQFSELAPATVYAVAALIRLYAPMLTVQVEGTSSGTVSSTNLVFSDGTSNAGNMDCESGTCSSLLVQGAQVTLTANPTTVTWGGDCSSAGTSPTATVTLTADMTCIATFSSSTLTVQKAGTGTGTVTSSPAGINCGTSCLIQSAPFNGSAQLTAVADSGSSFAGWGGDCSGTALTTSVSVTNSNENCIATFSLGSMLTITLSGTGTGTVVSVPAGINCGSACSASLTGSVQLTATPLPGSTFTSWGGACSGTNPTTTINVSGNTSCTVTFSSPVAVALNPFGSQAITQAPGPYYVEAVNASVSPIAAPTAITVTLLRKVVSECSGVLFSSNVTATISQGQMSTTYGFVAGRDPACNTLPITTTFTVTQAVMAPNITLDLSGVPAAQLSLSVVR